MLGSELSRIAQGFVRRVHYALFDKPFDWLTDVNTCEVPPPPPGGEVFHAGNYEHESSPVLGVWYSLASLGIDARRFVFVDLGSGKGRGVLVASALPFRRVEGVEFSPELHSVALENIRNYSGPRKTPIVALQLDARAYRIPADPCVIYMYNPFGEDVLRPVLRNVLASWRKKPRPIYIVYMNPVKTHVFKEIGVPQKKPRSRWHRAISALLSPHKMEIYRLPPTWVT